MLETRFQSELDQAWLRLWVSIYGPDSRLRCYLKEDNRIAPPPRGGDRGSAPAGRHARPAPVEKKARPLRPAVPREVRRVERDVERAIRMPAADWAKRIIGDPRIANITLTEVLEGIEDYFTFCDGMRRVNPDAYAYFSRIGPPMITNKTGIWETQIDHIDIPDPAALPSYFGIYLPSSAARYRDDTIKDKITLLDFHLFEKPKNHATVAPSGMTVFTHAMIGLGRKRLFSKEEAKQFPWGVRNLAIWWYIAIGPGGEVRALPCRMTHYQKLPNGAGVHHSRFSIPPGLYELGEERGKPHQFVRRIFNVALAFAASGNSGIQVTIRKDKKAIRIGLPVTALRDFFYDREPGPNGRRKAIIHYRHGHDRHMGDGRIIEVGEHLSGERFFSWRGYDVTVGVPGIHYPSPEAFAADLYMSGDPDAPLPATSEKLVSMKVAGNEFKEMIWKSPKQVPIRKGIPTKQHLYDKLPLPPEGRRPGDPALPFKAEEQEDGIILDEEPPNHAASSTSTR